MGVTQDLLENIFQRFEGTAIASIEDNWGEVYILDNAEYRSMKFDHLYEQSKMLLCDPSYPVFSYVRAMLFGLVFNNAKRVLHLGLGGGSLVKAVYQLNPDIQQTVVELRAQVIALAIKYFFMPTVPRIQIHCADAQRYLQHAHQQQDIIFADMYLALKMAPLQAQLAFVRACRRLLSPKGWLVINYIGKEEISEGMLMAFYQYFDDVLVCSLLNGNAVLYAGTLSPDIELSNLAQEVSVFERKLHCKIGILAKFVTRLPEPVMSIEN